jgi:sulfur carrier protein
MEITVNQQNHSVTDNCTLQQMLAIVIQQPLTGVAVAINQQIIPKNSWDSHLLKSNDNIILIKATQGG